MKRTLSMIEAPPSDPVGSVAGVFPSPYAEPDAEGSTPVLGLLEACEAGTGPHIVVHEASLVFFGYRRFEREEIRIGRSVLVVECAPTRSAQRPEAVVNLPPYR